MFSCMIDGVTNCGEKWNEEPAKTTFADTDLCSARADGYVALGQAISLARPIPLYINY
jgi:hypothetical protein